GTTRARSGPFGFDCSAAMTCFHSQSILLCWRVFRLRSMQGARFSNSVMGDQPTASIYFSSECAKDNCRSETRGRDKAMLTTQLSERRQRAAEMLEHGRRLQRTL